MNKSKVKKIRADRLLVEKSLCDSLEDAFKLILAGKVRVGSDCLIHNPSEMISEDAVINVEIPSPYVSRGAFKLENSLNKFLPDLSGLAALDVGASTGGFTDLMLQKGARRVYTVDSGRGQLHMKLRNDLRVICHEQTNARTVKDDFLPEKVDIMTMDVSFISVTAILPNVNKFLKPGGWAFILVKPQFEAPRNLVPQGGVVTDEDVIRECVEKVISCCTSELSWHFKDSSPSPIKGPKGNQEYMTVFQS